jgi:predicted DNA-binding protein
MIPNFKNLDIPISFRVPHKIHKQYKKLSGHERKTIQYKFNMWIEKQLKKVNEK